MMTRSTILLPVLALALATGCTRDASEESARGTEPATGFLVATEPAGAQTVSAVKAAAVEGASVVVRGRIGGRREAIAPDGGMFLIVDAEIPSCAEGDDDGCPTPWDFCCEPRERLLPALASVQVVDDGGAPLAVDLRAAGFKELDEIVVVGTVAARPSPDVLVIEATGIHRVSG